MTIEVFFLFWLCVGWPATVTLITLFIVNRWYRWPLFQNIVFWFKARIDRATRWDHNA